MPALYCAVDTCTERCAALTVRAAISASCSIIRSAPRLSSTCWNAVSTAKEIFFTARQFTAAEALQMGLVNRVLPEAELEKYVKDYAETISGNAPLTVNSVKYIVGEAVKDESARDLKRCADLVAQCFASKDYTEGRKAFMEKRKPAFTGS